MVSTLQASIMVLFLAAACVALGYQMALTITGRKLVICPNKKCCLNYNGECHASTIKIKVLQQEEDTELACCDYKKRRNKWR